MKKKKTLLGSVAGGALALALVGGGTFAAWSDFAEVPNNESGAGVLTLDVSAKDGTPTFTVDDMVPGGGSEQNIYLVNRDADAVPLAALTMKFQNVLENENDCSSNSEKVADPSCDDPGQQLAGEFGAQAKTQILSTVPGAVSTAADCPNSGGYNSISPSTHNRTLSQVLNQLTASDAPIPGGAYSLGNLAPGQGVCLRMNVSLPIAATDAVQGDSVSYDVRFDLAQVV